MEPNDPRVVTTVAVTASDVVDAVEADRQRDRSVVLRITPPFSGRMRARIHVGERDYGTGPEPIHVDPERLLADDAPAYPRPADTEDALRADPDVEYTVERHHERHAAAVAAWRERVRDHFVDEVTLDLDGDAHTVAVTVLG